MLSLRAAIRSLEFRPWKIIAAISLSTLAATSATIALLYYTARQEQLHDLERATGTLASLMEAVARFDLQSGIASDSEGARKATLSQIEQGIAGYIGTRGGEELVIGQKVGNRLQILRARREGGWGIAADLEYDGINAVPLYAATRGRTGKGEFFDYRGAKVLAAYAPVPSLGIGIVYKVDLVAMQAPYVRAGMWTGGVYLCLVTALVVGHLRSTRDLAHRASTSEGQLSSLFERAPIILLLIDAKGKILRANPTFCQLTGWSRADVEGRNAFSTLIPERDRERIRALFRSSPDNAPKDGNINPILTKSGAERLVEWHNQALRDADGRPSGLLAVGIDVTERQATQDQLRIKESAMHSALAGIAIADLDGKLTYANPTWLSLHGFTSAADALDRPVGDFVVNRSTAQAIIAELFARGRWAGELLCRRLDGSSFLAEISTNLVADSDGRPLCLQASFRDITERKRTEETIRHQKDLLQLILDHLAEGVVACDAEGRLNLFNRTARQWHGLDANQSSPGTWSQSYNLCQADGITPLPTEQIPLVRALRGESIRESGMSIVAPGSPPRFLIANGGPLWGPEGNLLGAVVVMHDITERQRAEEALRASETQLRALVEGAFDGILLADIESRRFTFANPAMCRLLGASSLDEVLSLGLADIHPAESLPSLIPAFEAMAQGKLFHIHDIPLLRRDGTLRDIDISGSVITIGDRRYNVGIFRDITERKRAEQALLDSEHRLFRERNLLRTLIDALPDLVYFKDASGRYVIANHRMAEMAHAPSPEALTGKLPQDVFPPDLGKRFFKSDQALITSGEPQDTPATLLQDKDGNARWYITRKIPVKDASGAITGLVGIGHDITEIKRASDALAASERRFRHVVESIPSGVILADASGAIVLVNEGLCRNFGYTKDELVGQPVELLLPERLRDAHKHNRTAYSHHPEARPMGFGRELFGRRKDGSQFPVEIGLQPFETDEGRLVLAVVTDITLRHHAEESIRAANLRLQHTQAIAKVGSWELDLRTNALIWSTETYRIFGRTPTTFGHTLADFLATVPLEDRVSLERTLFDSIQKHVTYFFTHRILTPEGAIRWVQEQGETFYDPNGTPLRIVGAVQDITATVASQAALLASERSLNEAQTLAHLGSWRLDLTNNFLHWSNEIFRLFEIDPSKFGASYEAFLNAIHPEDRDAVNQAYSNSLRTRRPYEITHRLLMPDGRIKWVQERCETDYAEDGTPIRSRGTVQDVTERVLTEKNLEASLREKTTLLQEVHHRVKNNLQVVSSMLFFEQRQATDPVVVAQFQRSRDRVAAISLVHESLYQMADLSGINFSDYVANLGRQIIQEFSGSAGPVSLRIEGAGFTLGITEAVPAALIVNELLTNSLKHAFPHGKGGVISLRIELGDDGSRHLRYADNGVGAPPAAPSPTRSRSLGMRLVERLTDQLQATLVREPAATGTAFHLTIPPAPRALS